ncbi:hypothetical protein HY439_02890 [Candidatus Microgenomates bacterium]|nr:hypothetical protein [Candidatus Microgenomates bacterium]
MKILPRIFVIFSFFLALSITVFIATPVRAQLLQQENQTILDPSSQGPGFDDKAFNLNQMAGTVDSLNYLLTGQSEAHPELLDLGNSGAIGAVGTLISKLYVPPASTADYIAYLKQNVGLATPAYAQGTGFKGLSYLLPIWAAFRNAAYFVFILIFMVVGIMIMLRIKISPQAVVSIQTALPRLLITLVLITLSYAIAGLLIDLMYVIIYLILNLFKSVPGINFDGFDQFSGANVFGYWSSVSNLGFESINKPAEGISKFVEEITGNLFILSGFLSTGARGIATAVFAVAILWALFRLLFILIKAYVWVLVMIIFAPFQLLLGALPGGSSLGISGWVRGIFANLMVFPTTIAMFALASTLIQLTKAGQPGATGWVAPLIGGNSPAIVQALIALGIILLTPAVAQMMTDAIKPPPFPYGAAIGQALGAGPAMGTGIARRAGMAASYEMGPGGQSRQVQWRALFR